MSVASSRHVLAANEGSLECKVCSDWLADHGVLRLDCAGQHSFCLSCVVRWFRPSLSSASQVCSTPAARGPNIKRAESESCRCRARSGLGQVGETDGAGKEKTADPSCAHGRQVG